MRRRLFSLASLLSLLLCLATVVLWVRTNDALRQFDIGEWMVACGNGRLNVLHRGPINGPYFDAVYEVLIEKIAAFFGVLAGVGFLVGRRSAQNQSQFGSCHHCGYDLTGNTSGVCSECGTPVGRKAGA